MSKINSDDLSIWFSNLPDDERESLGFDYRDQFETLFPGSNLQHDLDWLCENHNTSYESLKSFLASGERDQVLKYRKLAKDYAEDGRIEFDEEPLVSIGDDPGAYVRGWIWIPNTVKAEVEIWADDSPECPNDWGGWKLCSFNTRHASFVDPSELGDPDEMKAKLKNEEAFMLSFYSHGSDHWFIKKAPTSVIPDREWDCVEDAGILVWDGDEPPHFDSKEELLKSAQGYCETFNSWANGHVYGYTIEDGPGIDGASCGGFYHAKDLIEDVTGQLPDGCDIEWTGDYTYIVD